jgi:hypothetical protein
MSDLKEKNRFKAQLLKNFLGILNFMAIFTAAIKYYSDIRTDILVCVEYSQDKEFTWFGITLSFVVLSLIFQSIGLFYLYRIERIYKWSIGKCKQVFFRVMCILFQLEMIYW